MKREEMLKKLRASTGARLLGAFLLIAPCTMGLTACGDDDPEKPSGPDAGEPVCGNGVIEDGEECDGTALPTGAAPGSTCLDTCELKGPDCGNGVVDDGEECDPEAAMPSKYPEGATCSSACKAQYCGNGRIDGNEECDLDALPAGLPSGAQCRNDCTIEPCGNGVIDEGEECDINAPVPVTGSVCLPGCTLDLCPNDEDKTDPGQCGCGVKEDTEDDDDDGVINCLDACPNDFWKSGKPNEDDCDCGKTKVGESCYTNINTVEDFLHYRDNWSTIGDAILKYDIDLSHGDGALAVTDGAIEWIGIGNGISSAAYTATFLGDNKTITATDGTDRVLLNCTKKNCGLFAQIQGATIRDLIVDVEFEAAPVGSEEEQTAGLLVGLMNGGTLSNVHSKGSLLVAQGSGSSMAAGGLVGHISSGTVFDASSSVAVEVRGHDSGEAVSVGGLIGQQKGSDAYNVWATGDVSFTGIAEAHVGGLIGQLDSSLANAYALGTVESSTGELVGTVKPGSVGGFIGKVVSGSIANVYAFGNTTHRSVDASGALIGNASEAAVVAQTYIHKGKTCVGSTNSLTISCNEMIESLRTIEGAEVTTLVVEDDEQNQKTLLSQLNNFISGISSCPEVSAADGCLIVNDNSEENFARYWENKPVVTIDSKDYRFPGFKGL